MNTEQVTVSFVFDQESQYKPMLTELSIIPRAGEFVRIQSEGFENEDEWFLVVQVNHEIDLLQDTDGTYRATPHVNIELRKMPGSFWVLGNQE
ncbi:hypothetical protein NDA03_25785 [Trichocoleus sp. Lan]|uniref:hypothetical protein n=1 Tax=Trichocoleus sp. Lan TaxID=2933927 RepID=UPI00329781DC